MAERRGSAKKAKKSVKKTVRKPVPSDMVPARNGGRIWNGPAANPVAGPGRPKEEVRAKYLSLGATKGFDFLDSLLDGKVTVSLLGKCEACAHEQPINQEIVEHIIERVGVSIDHRLKANEQAMKYGTTAKELVITSQNASAFFEVVTAAAVELFGASGADRLKARALQLMETVK